MTTSQPDKRDFENYSGDLKSGHVSILNGQSLFGFRMVQISNGSFSQDCFLIMMLKNHELKRTINGQPLFSLRNNVPENTGR